MVKIYAYPANKEVRLSPHFRVGEFWTAGDTVRIDEELIERLEALYERLDCCKIVITSGYRPDEAGSQHALGKAADVNCWHIADGKEVRYQGKEILLAAEDVGFPGIGWIAGSAASRAAVHLDTRDSAYRFDEANGNRMVPGNSWYTFFGLDKPGNETIPSVVYQVYAGGRWLPEVTDTADYAGLPKKAVRGVRARLTRGSIQYRVHTGGRWLPWVQDHRDYAGLYGRHADGLQMRLVGLDGFAIEYRVAAVGGTYWPWVRNCGTGSDGYAGCFGRSFDRLQCRIVPV